MKYKFICVDYQNDFCAPEGKFYKERLCHEFINEILIPYFRENDIKIFEIISDYRLPRQSEFQAYCIPGTSGYQSQIPDDVKETDKIWIKAMNSPDWTRQNGGIPNSETQKPIQNGAAFDQWLNDTVGEPRKNCIVVFGLTLDCCVHATLQQLYFRDYQKEKVLILDEAVDNFDPSIAIDQLGPNYKKLSYETTHGMFASHISWKALKPLLEEELANRPSFSCA